MAATLVTLQAAAIASQIWKVSERPMRSPRRQGAAVGALLEHAACPTKLLHGT